LLSNTQSTFLFQCERPSFTPTQNNDTQNPYELKF
jgi:hypothetical protein